METTKWSLRTMLWERLSCKGSTAYAYYSCFDPSWSQTGEDAGLVSRKKKTAVLDQTRMGISLIQCMCVAWVIFRLTFDDTAGSFVLLVLWCLNFYNIHIILVCKSIQKMSILLALCHSGSFYLSQMFICQATHDESSVQLMHVTFLRNGPIRLNVV